MRKKPNKKHLKGKGFLISGGNSHRFSMECRLYWKLFVEIQGKAYSGILSRTLDTGTKILKERVCKLGEVSFSYSIRKYPDFQAQGTTHHVEISDIQYISNKLSNRPDPNIEMQTDPKRSIKYNSIKWDKMQCGFREIDHARLTRHNPWHSSILQYV